MHRSFGNALLTAVLVSVATSTPALGQAGQPISLQQHTYQTVKAVPFNGQLAFYVADIRSSGGAVQVPITVQILIGNGLRPFAVDAGFMAPQEFNTYVEQLKLTGSVRVIPFQIQRRGERMTFEYLSRTFSVTASELVPCPNCPGRVVLTVE
jgi:hypothetical protein